MQKTTEVPVAKPQSEESLKPISAEFAREKRQASFRVVDQNHAKHHRALMFVRNGIPECWTKLHVAVWENDLTSVKRYVQYHQTSEEEVLLQQGRWGETALQLALRMERCPEMIRELLRGVGAEAVGFDLDEYFSKDEQYGLCFYPIHEATSYRSHGRALEVTRLLLERDADVDEMADCEATTPLVLAARHGHKEVLELLMRAGASFDQRNETLVLHAAVAAPTEEDALACLRYLATLKKRMAVDEKDRGTTALHLACSQLRAGVVEFLLREGADVRATDARGWTPLDRLLEADHQHSHSARQIRKLIRDASLSVALNLKIVLQKKLEVPLNY